MCKTSITVKFVCKLCRRSFQQVDDFIEHKKQEHFTQFQQISCIIFEETEHDEPCPTEINAENHLTDENIESPVKIEWDDDDPISPISSEIIDELNLDFFEPESELITFECEINPDRENNYFGLNQPEQNPYVLLKRLTSEEIQRACIPQHHSRLLRFDQKTLVNDSEPSTSSDVDISIIDLIQVAKSSEIQSSGSGSGTIINFSAVQSLQFECKLCLKQHQFDAELRDHVEICARDHKDRKLYCVICNQKFSHRKNLRRHCKRYHGTEEEKASLYKLECHLCPMKCRSNWNLNVHLKSHNKNSEQVKTSKSLSKSTGSKPFKCLQPNCGKEWSDMYKLRRHLATHFGLKPFSCPFPNCNKKCAQKIHLKSHLRTHTGERPPTNAPRSTATKLPLYIHRKTDQPQ